MSKPAIIHILQMRNLCNNYFLYVDTPYYDDIVGFIDGTLNPVARPIRDQRAIYNGHAVSTKKK